MGLNNYNLSQETIVEVNYKVGVRLEGMKTPELLVLRAPTLVVKFVHTAQPQLI